MTIRYSHKILGLTLSLILFAGSAGAVFAENEWTQEQLETGQYSIADPNGPGVGAHNDPDNRAQYHIDQLTNLGAFEVAAAVIPLEGCSCVVFRMDDVQDFFVSDVQVAIMDEFTSRDEFLSIGPIQNFFGTDAAVLATAQAGETSGLFEVFDHGWNHTDFTLDNLGNQTSDMGLAQAKAVTQFGEAPNVFIPPFNAWNADTITAMGDNGLTILSSQVSLETTPAHIFQADGSVPHTVDVSGIYHLPVDAFVVDVTTVPDERRTPAEILTAIDSSITARGYAVLLFHPAEFAIGELVNATAFAELEAVIDGVNAKNYPIRTFNQVVAFNGTVSIGDVTQVEGNTGTSNFVFDVTRSDTSGSMSVDYTVVDGTATVGDSDYNTIPDATLAFADGGVLTKTITVPVVGDSTVEPDEIFNVNLSNCIGCTIVDSLGPVTTGVGVGTITNDDADISIDDVAILEGNSGTTDFVFTVTRTNNVGTTSVGYTTADNSATQPSDYTTTSGTLVIPNGGPLTDTITVPVVGDTPIESDEIFNVNLASCVGCNITDAQGAGTILNDDTVGPQEQDLGSPGSGSGQFNDPSDVAVDSNNRIIVADTNNNRIQIFNSAGTFLSQFGTPGSSNTQFNNPLDVAVDSNNRIIVADTNNNRIQIFGSDGVYQSQFGTPGSGNGQFDAPVGLAVDSNNRIIVADSSNQRIQIFNSAGVYQSQFGTPGSGNAQFSFPSGVGADSNNRIIVADSNNHRIQIFNSAGVYQSQFGTPGSGNGEFGNPSDIEIKSADRILVADTFNDRIQIFDSTGLHIQSFGSQGSGDGQFNNPSGVVVDSTERVIVADTFNNRIQIFQASTLVLNDLDSDGIPDSNDTENIITTSTLLTGSHTVANVTVQNGALLTIPNGFTLMITSGNNLTIESGSGVLVKSGGTLQINQ